MSSSKSNPFANHPSFSQKQNASQTVIDSMSASGADQEDDEVDRVNNETFGQDETLVGNDEKLPDFFNFNISTTTAAAAAKANSATSNATATAPAPAVAGEKKSLGKKDKSANNVKNADNSKSSSTNSNTNTNSSSSSSSSSDGKKRVEVNSLFGAKSAATETPAPTVVTSTATAPEKGRVKISLPWSNVVSGNSAASSSSTTTSSSAAGTISISSSEVTAVTTTPVSNVNEGGVDYGLDQQAGMPMQMQMPMWDPNMMHYPPPHMPYPPNHMMPFGQPPNHMMPFPPHMMPFPPHMTGPPHLMPYPPHMLPHPPHMMMTPPAPSPALLPNPAPSNNNNINNNSNNNNNNNNNNKNVEKIGSISFKSHLPTGGGAPSRLESDKSQDTANSPAGPRKFQSRDSSNSTHNNAGGELGAPNRFNGDKDSASSSTGPRKFQNRDSSNNSTYNKEGNSNFNKYGNRAPIKQGSDSYSPRTPYAPRVPQDRAVVDWMAKLPRGQKMSKRDVEFVVKKVLEPLQSVDPFDDNYYHIHHKMRENGRLQKAYLGSVESIRASGGSVEQIEALERPPFLIIPLPTWKDLKVRIKSQIDSVKQRNLEKTKHWVKTQKVLGNVTKAQVGKPREVIAIAGLNDILNSIASENSNDESGEAKTSSEDTLKIPFASVSWTMREAVQKGYEAMYTVQELNYLKNDQSVLGNPDDFAEVCGEINAALVTLAQSLGIRMITKHVEDEFGSREVEETGIDEKLVAAIFSTSKGKRLVSRGLALITPEQKWALLPAIIVRTLLVNPADQKEDDKIIESKLIMIVSQFVDLAADHHEKQIAEQGLGNKFSFTLLRHLNNCIQGINLSFDYTQKAYLIGSLIESRAVLIDAIVRLGNHIASTFAMSPAAACVAAKKEWDHTHTLFFSLIK